LAGPGLIQQPVDDLTLPGTQFQAPAGAGPFGTVT
jgi:hypothetical protein